LRELSSVLRKQLETSVLAARRAGESASRAALDGLGVFTDRRPEHLDTDRAALRVGLRAKWRQLGSDRELLVAECAYEQWHQLLFARFLAENGLLLHPRFKAPVTLADCEELAAELGEPDAWSVAARFAAEILPGIFRLDDPCVRLRLAPEGRDALERILDALPAETFAADDALGWVYQFWQKDKKDEVNASERKIGGADLGPVTQLFTENYMVRFLLENSLGAWWAARHPDSPLLDQFDYLRVDDRGSPAAGSFDGWPDRVAEITVMDPCCGSGHFLVEAFSMLWHMRSEEDGLSAVAAQDAVLRDNLFGLELDARCVQIAMFALALRAWKAGGAWRQLPTPHLACSGVQVRAGAGDWKDLARGDERVERALVRLHGLFREAGTLGSLIHPRRAAEVTDPSGRQASLDHVDWSEVEPLFDSAVTSETQDPATAVLGAHFTGLARAASYLSRTYTLVATNVPYLAKGSQTDVLRTFVERRYPDADRDLATVFLERLRELRVSGGSIASVLPQSWLYLTSYEALRRRLLVQDRWNLLARLGAGAFEGITGEVVNVCLLIASGGGVTETHRVVGLDLADTPGPTEKARLCAHGPLVSASQRDQLAHLGARFSFETLVGSGLLANVADSYQGLKSGDNPRFVRAFWELASIQPGWAPLQSHVNSTRLWGGRSQVVRWVDNGRELKASAQARVQGTGAWGRSGVVVREMKSLPATLYGGDIFESSGIAIIPRRSEDLPAVWAFCSSPEFNLAVRRIDQKLSVATATVTQVPFDLARWREAAEQAGPLSAPCSDDPTQWLFRGRPEVATAPLQVAVARLAGYGWPEQEQDDLDLLADADGIVCLPSVAGEPPAAVRLQQVLTTAFGASWSPGAVSQLLEQAGSKKQSLSAWLRDEFFRQHCALFGNRPFIWHIWDGQRDGFSALVNYHRLDRMTLEKLTFTYLGQDWVERQRAETRDEIAGAEARLSAALTLQRKLEAILEGEAPYDIFVRWKPTHQQPIGWEPDLNDGVRLNVRPFVEAGVLRAPFNIHWRKDRGKNPDGSERENDIHVTLAERQSARKEAGKS
jgi:restriction-modification enzyme MmeI-like protein